MVGKMYALYIYIYIYQSIVHRLNLSMHLGTILPASGEYIQTDIGRSK